MLQQPLTHSQPSRGVPLTCHLFLSAPYWNSFLEVCSALTILLSNLRRLQDVIAATPSNSFHRLPEDIQHLVLDLVWPNSPRRARNSKVEVSRAVHATVLLTSSCCAQAHPSCCAGAGVVHISARVQELASLLPQQARLAQVH